MIAAVERRKPVTAGVEAELRGVTIAVAFVMKVAGEEAVEMLRTVTGVGREVVSLTPSSPAEFRPNVRTVPSWRRTAV